MSLASVIEYSRDIQTFLDQLILIPIFYTSSSFVLTTVVAYISFEVTLNRFSSEAEVLRYVSFKENYKANIRWGFIKYKIGQAIVTGLASTAIITLQSGKFNFIFAIFYGLMGPYFLKDKLEKLLEKNITTEINNQIEDDSRNKIVNSIFEDEYRKIVEQFIASGADSNPHTHDQRHR